MLVMEFLFWWWWETSIIKKFKKEYLPDQNEFTSALLIEFTKKTWKKIYSNGLYVYFFIKDSLFDLEDIVRLHNE